ncbi:tetratricopeptide repeat protein [Aliikangiella coralliicola]|uniref:Tetratricopeptide repeat protein n=1 Tax=Aliikangiella coralliicola TaxID=2592383 RepID=A0A545UC59_9GAMM|nr:hypothetical protein [Aliikangiella coralliicola]TQV87061.1 hypothetical protein FLL46_14745 [Aliikangiella coralliicola]
MRLFQHLNCLSIKKASLLALILLSLSYSAVFATSNEDSNVPLRSTPSLTTEAAVHGREKIEELGLLLMKAKVDSSSANELANAIIHQNWRGISTYIIQQKKRPLILERLGVISYLAPGSKIEGRTPFSRCTQSCIKQYDALSSMLVNQVSESRAEKNSNNDLTRQDISSVSAGDFPVLSVLRADSLLHSGNSEAAEKYLRDLIGESSASAEVKGVAYNMLAILSIQKNSIGEALNFFNKAKETPAYYEPHFNLAIFYLNQALSGPSEITALFEHVYLSDPFFVFWHPFEVDKTKLIEGDTGAYVLIVISKLAAVLAKIFRGGGNTSELLKGTNFEVVRECGPGINGRPCKYFSKHYAVEEK